MAPPIVDVYERISVSDVVSGCRGNGMILSYIKGEVGGGGESGIRGGGGLEFTVLELDNSEGNIPTILLWWRLRL